MEYDFYMQGLPEKNDGEVILSLSKDELGKVMNHPFRKTNVFRDLVQRAVGSLENPGRGVLTPKELSEFVDELNEENKGMISEGVFQVINRNPKIQENFYLNQVFSIINEYASHSIKGERNLVVVADPFEFSYCDNIQFGFSGIMCAKNFGLFSVTDGKLEYANLENNRYAGWVSFLDNVEGCEGKENWIAKPIPLEARMKSRGKNFEDLPYYVREKKINILTNEYTFTLSSILNTAMRDYAFELISQFKEAASVGREE